MSSKGPLKIENAQEIALCTCMQSSHWPLCDATHHTLGGDGPQHITTRSKKKPIIFVPAIKPKSRPIVTGPMKKYDKDLFIEMTLCIQDHQP